MTTAAGALPRVIDAELRPRLAVFAKPASRPRLRTQQDGSRSAAGIMLARPGRANPREDWADVGMLLAGAVLPVAGWDAVRARGVDKPRPQTPLACDGALAGHVVGRMHRPSFASGGPTSRSA